MELMLADRVVRRSYNPGALSNLAQGSFSWNSTTRLRLCFGWHGLKMIATILRHRDHQNAALLFEQIEAFLQISPKRHQFRLLTMLLG